MITYEDAAVFNESVFLAKFLYFANDLDFSAPHSSSGRQKTIRSSKLKLDVANETGKIIGMSAVSLVRANGLISNRHENFFSPGKKFTPSSLQGNFTIRISRAAEIVYPTLFFSLLSSLFFPLSFTSPRRLSFFVIEVST